MDQADHLLVIRLNNFSAIEAAFGLAAVRGAMDHLRHAAERHLRRIDLRHGERDEMVFRARPSLLTNAPAGTLVDTLCGALGAEPFRHGEDDIMLSVSAGYAVAGGRIGRTLEEEARTRMAASTLQARYMVGRSEEWAAFYRKDMAAAAHLLRLMRRGALFLTWRPVLWCGEQGTTLYHEAILRYGKETGEQIDCADAYAAAERLGLAYLVDRLLLSDVLDELEGDPAACLSIAISSQSLSLNLHGEGAGWTDLLARLKRNRGLARRLVVEIADNRAINRFRDALAFVRALRGLGVRISVARFGSGQASIGQLRTLAPDMVKLDSLFMRAACQCEGNRPRIGQLLALARTVSPTVIVDGIESPRHLRLALEEGAEWGAGAHLGRPAARRGWLGQDYGAGVASLASFGSALHYRAGPSGAFFR